jgi:hypothetical protein
MFDELTLIIDSKVMTVSFLKEDFKIMRNYSKLIAAPAPDGRRMMSEEAEIIGYYIACITAQ